MNYKIDEFMKDKDLNYIASPVSNHLIEDELKKVGLVKKTNKLNNEVYIINAHNSPNVMYEIGRLRELSFAMAGGGTRNPVDIDSRDTSENCYQQLIVYSPEDKALIGGYRFLKGSTIKQNNISDLSTNVYFNFSEQFINDFLPYCVELGRSWINPAFQPMNNPRKGLFSLDNLWDGLGAIVVQNPEMLYFFGKVTMYEDFPKDVKTAVLGFMKYYFPDSDNLVTPIHPIFKDCLTHSFIKEIVNVPFKEGLKLLQQFCRKNGQNIPPLINNYMQLSSTMKSFGTAINPDFGGVDETGILVTIADIFLEKKERHLSINK